ncbi:MAG: Lrp/AsnC family transcriptional regulator [Gammaproteobacteria bacterium]|jgi:Lrp/AsnC family transcriptional regulator|nr:Lrp/AsnC family transcriptional regulator [Gammaproteobacteria bacterium]
MKPLDAHDRRILEALQRDAQQPLAELAESVALSRTACWRRIQRLEAEGILEGRVALVNAEKVGLGLTVYVLIKTNQHTEAWSKAFHRVIQDIPEVLESYRMSGEVDYLLKAVVSDMAGYDRLYKKLIAVDLFDVSSSFVMETLKHSTALPLR